MSAYGNILLDHDSPNSQKLDSFDGNIPSTILAQNRTQWKASFRVKSTHTHLASLPSASSDCWRAENRKNAVARRHKKSVQQQQELSAQINVGVTLRHRLLSLPRPEPQHRLTVALINPQGNFSKGYKGINTHPDMGGQIIYVGELAKALARHGVNAVIAARRYLDERVPEFNQARELILETETATASAIRVSGNDGDSFIRKEDLWPILDAWARQLAIHWTVNGEMPHALTSHYGDGGFAATRLEEYLGVPHATFTAHSLGAQKLDSLKSSGSLSTSDELGHLNIPRRLAAERLSMKTARKIIVSTEVERTEQYAHDLYAGAVDWRDPARFSTVPPGVDVGIFGPVADSGDKETIELLQMAIQRDVAQNRRHLPLIVVAGRLVPKKNHARTVRAFAENTKLRARANLLLLLPGGSDALRASDKAFGTQSEEFAVADQIRSVVLDHGLGGQIIVPGLDNTQRQLAAIYRYLGSSSQRGVLSSPSLFEPFGLLPLEAATAGLPAVVGDRGGTAESLRERLPGGGTRDCAVFVDPYSIQDISRGLLLLIASAKKWREIRNAARERVARKYTWDSAATGYVNIIKATLATEYLRAHIGC